MNLFILDYCPVCAAEQQCDKHVPKMIVESAQMLCTAHRMLDGFETRKPSKSGKTMVKYYELEDDSEELFYKAVHFNHPCTVWTRETLANYNWHYKHFVALCDEYTHRYGKLHLTDQLLREPLKTPPRNIPRTLGQTPFPLAMKSNPECMFPNDPVKSYRMFYQTKQHRFNMVWSKREVPEWFVYV